MNTMTIGLGLSSKHCLSIRFGTRQFDTACQQFWVLRGSACIGDGGPAPTFFARAGFPNAKPVQFCFSESLRSGVARNAKAAPLCKTFCQPFHSCPASLTDNCACKPGFDNQLRKGSFADWRAYLQFIFHPACIVGVFNPRLDTRSAPRDRLTLDVACFRTAA